MGLRGGGLDDGEFAGQGARMQVGVLGGAAACVAVAAFGVIAEHRRTRRRNPDRVGVVSWTTVQLVALFAAVILAALAITG